MRSTFIVLALAMLSATSGIATAQDNYPSRQVRVVVGWPPGNVVDAQARVVAKRMSEELGQPAVVDNRPGAAATIGAQYVARSAPDGYTLLIGGPPELMISPLLNPKLPYQRKDFTLVLELGASDFALMVNTSLNVSTMREFIALAKAKPGQISYASVGNGSIHHLAMEEFQYLTGVKLLHVPYKGGSQAGPALLANEVSVMFTATGSSTTNVALSSGRAKLLGLAGSKRSEFAPEVPTTEELGIGRMDFNLASSVFAPAGTPSPIVRKLADVLAKVMIHPEVTKGMRAVGVTPTGSTAEEVAPRERAQSEAISRIIKSAGIVLQD